MTDILVKLKELKEKTQYVDHIDDACITEAMDEIDRLRKQINLHNFRAPIIHKEVKNQPSEKETPFRWSEYTGK